MTEPTTEELENKVINDAVQFWMKIYQEKEVIIRFIKKDGSVRIMRCTLDFTKIPEYDKPKKVDIDRILKLIRKNKIMHVFDLDQMGWRSVPFDRVEWMDTQNQRYVIRKKKY